MKIEDVPQDLKYFKDVVIRDQEYAVDDQGRYQMVESDGWTPKNEALEITLDAIDEECEEILERIRIGKTSPLEYHAAKNLMSVELLSTYSGFSKRTIRKHFNPRVFANLDKDVLSKYAEVLRITVDDLTSIPE